MAEVQRMGGCRRTVYLPALQYSPFPSGLQMLPVASTSLLATRGVPCLSQTIP